MSRFGKFTSVKPGLIVVIVAGLLLGASQVSQAQITMEQEKAPEQEKPKPTLKLGDAAPKIEVEKFLKGSPVNAFEGGKVYVVEFWATWCKPCIKAFPHLSELQKKYAAKGVTFIGINIWDGDEAEDFNAELLSTVESFVAGQGDRMSYTVAYDGGAKKMEQGYMQASGQDGIPTAFAVDQRGRIAWIGHPEEIDEPLEQIVAGKWDIAKAQAEEARKAEVQDKAKPIFARMSEAYMSQKWDDLFAAMDELKKLDAKMFALMDAQKFQLLLTELHQYDRAYAMKEELLANKEIMKSAESTNAIAWSVVDPGNDVTQRNVEFALSFAQKAVELSEEKDPAIIDTLARVYWVKGDKAKAVELQEKAIKLCTPGSEFEDYKADLENTLKEFKEGAK